MPNRLNGDLPLIETVAIFDAHVSGICQLDKIGPDCVITYCALRLDPCINGGLLFRTPIVRLTRPYEYLARQRGALSHWIDSGPPEGTMLVPLARGPGERRLLVPRH